MSMVFFFPPLIVFELPLFFLLLGEMGYQVVAASSQAVKSTVDAHQFQECDVVFKTKGGVDIGVIQAEDGSIELVCDEVELENVEHVTKEELHRNLTQKYTHRKVADELARHGFSIVEETVQDDETIKIKVRRWN